MPEKPRRSRAGLVIFLLFLLIAVAGVLAFKVTGDVRETFGAPAPGLSLPSLLRQTLSLYTARESLLQASPLIQEAKFRISPDEPVPGLCARLETEGFVRSAEQTCAYLIYSGLDRRLQSGSFTLEPGLSALQIAQRFADPAARDLQLTIFAGWRVEEVIESSSVFGAAFPSQALLELGLHPPATLAQNLGLIPGQSTEGYFEPGSHFFKPYSLPETVLADLVRKRVSEGLRPEISARAKALGLNWRQVLTIASMIEREAMQTEEMPLISSVFHNRLAQGMRLEMDSTVQYALGQSGNWWKAPLSLDDTRTVSPYNTYQVTGLPPGPICNPSDEAIQAALQPEESDYYFFVARCDGSGLHNFSRTFEEHLENLCP